MWKIITKNFGIKLFCLFAAGLLWVYIAAGQNSVGKFPGSIKIRAINVPSGLVASYDAKTVDIKVMADPLIWRKLSAETFSAYVDLSAHSEGTYELDVNVVSSIPGVQIVEKNPDKIFVSLEPIISKEVNINKKIEGNAADGLVAGSIDLLPTKVEAKGPKSLINNLTEATVVVKLNGETSDFTKTLTVKAFNEKGDEIEGIDFIPDEVKATIPIVKTSNNKTVGIKAKIEGSPKAGYYVSSIIINPSTVDILGPAEVLNVINFIETFAIDVTNSSSDLEKEIPLDLKSGVTLQQNSPSKVKVKIKFSRSEITREISPSITTKNLDSSLYPSTITPNQIKVIISGPIDTINNLKASDVVLALDFQDKKASQGGTYNFDLNSKSFSAPDGVSIISILPSSIYVVVDKKSS
ncbi:MAG: CdaR family protein [Patescibacteria group bacterium]|nr:CdaR family protein [Patescibacteria group bacterium]